MSTEASSPSLYNIFPLNHHLARYSCEFRIDTLEVTILGLDKSKLRHVNLVFRMGDAITSQVLFNALDPPANR